MNSTKETPKEKTDKNTSSKMVSSRKISLLAGLLYLLTFVSIPTLILYGPLHQTNYLLSSGSDTSALIGGVLEITIALAGIGTAIVLFPILKKQNESAALGLVAARILESATIFVAVAFILSLVTLHQTGLGAESLVAGHTLITLYDRIFLLGQSFMPAICDLILGILLYKSRLVPRALSLVGIIGAPILIVGYFAILFGFVARISPLAAISAVPVALFEFSLGIWLITKGFNKESLLLK